MSSSRAQLLKLAKAKWGKDAYVEENKHALDPETREIVRRERDRVKAAEPPKPPEVLAWEAKHKAWYNEWKTLRDRTMGLPRYRVGYRSSWANHVQGWGDDWEQAAKQANLIEPKA